MSNLPCKRCGGYKMVKNFRFTTTETTTHGDGSTTVGPAIEHPEHYTPCYGCDGTGEFPAVDIDKLRETILATKGKNKGKLRASMASPTSGMEAKRAYYVWRLARFHGGADMTMPVMADLLIRHDPFKPLLDAIADAVAKITFKTDLAAAYRWGRALGAI